MTLTHISSFNLLLRNWTSEWGGKIVFSHGTEDARGVCVMVNPNSLFQVESVKIDLEGRFIVLAN